MHGPRVSWLVGALVLALFAASGGAGLIGAQVEDPPAVESGDSTANAGGADVMSVPAVQAAIAAAALDTGQDPSAIVVVQADPVEWSDGSLGCPQPGRLYPQVITPGWRVQLGAGDEILDYHTNATGTLLVLCEPTPIPPSEPRPSCPSPG